MRSRRAGRAVSPIIGVAIVIAVTIALGAAIYYYATMAMQQGKPRGGSIVIAYARLLRESSGYYTLQLKVEGVGADAVTITNIYIDGSLVASNVSATVNPGQLLPITVENIVGTWSVGQKVTVKVEYRDPYGTNAEKTVVTVEQA